MGLKIRSSNDDSAPMITGNTEIAINVDPAPNNTNVINRVWTMVMDKVTDVIDHVMDESIDSVECDECDGIFQNFSEIKNSVENKVNCNTTTEEALEKEIILDKVLNMPSQPSQGSLQEGRTQRGQETTINKSAITVGDRVTVEDCPGHWNWASPFTVEAIGGGMAKLEMVSELVEVSRLNLSQKQELK